MSSPSQVESIFFAALERQSPEELAGYLDQACGTDADLRRQVERLLRAHPKAADFLAHPPLDLERSGVERHEEAPTEALTGTSESLLASDTEAAGVTLRPHGDHAEAFRTQSETETAAGERLDRTEAHLPPTEAESVGRLVGREARDGIGSVIAGRYTLLEVIGEGGMGSVYLAEQTEPVKRRVALKLIRAGMDSRGVLARFDAERQALALMDHPNIARIHDGGVTPAGRPFFVMELVRGEPLTSYCDRQRLSVRARLELFVSVCQAVQHAHQKGIIHRDLKPGNVLVTEVDGRPTPKVIDFGVAKATEQKLTELSFADVGAIVGTPAYMSPEQADPTSFDIDTRTDVYALGVMLYELLAGSPPIDASRFQRGALLEMLRMVREVDPPRPSTKLSTSDALPNIAANRSIEPGRLSRLLQGELDWVVMKALEKDRSRRYDTANGLARDIQRYLSDEVVEARPPSKAYRLRKFAHRNPLQLALAGTLAVILLGGGAVAWWRAEQAQAGRERAARDAEAAAGLLSQCDEALRTGDTAKAALLLEAARKRSAEGGATKEADRLAKLNADLALSRDLDAVDQFRWTAIENKLPDLGGVSTRTREALARFGVDPDAVSADVAAARVATSAVHERIVSALDRLVRYEKSAEARALLRRVDADPFRDAFRDAVLAGDRAKVVELADRKEALEQPPGFTAFLGESSAVGLERRRRLLEMALIRRPGNLSLLMTLGGSYPFGAANVDERLRWYQAATAADPFNTAALNGLGLALHGKGRWDEAVACFTRAIELDPKFATSRNNLGMAMSSNGLVDKAIECFKKAIELDPTFAVAYLNLGMSADSKKLFDEAVQFYGKAIELDPNHPVAHNNLGSKLLAKGQVDEAIRCFKKAIELDPKYAFAHGGLGQALRFKGEVDEAIRCFKKAIELDPKDAFAHGGLGQALQSKGETDEAIASYGKAIELDPKNVVPRTNLGNALADRGRVDEAIASYKKVIELDPKISVAYSNLGNVLMNKRQVDEAIASYEKAIELDPKLSIAHCGLGNALADKGQFDESIASYEKAIKLDPKLVAAHTGLGSAFRRKGTFDESIASYKKAIELDPRNAVAYSGLGNALQAKRRFDESIASYKKAVELDPKFALPHYNLGISLHNRGSTDEAIGHYRKAIELDPKFAPAHINLGNLLKAKGQVDESIACYDKAVSLEPKFALAHSNLGNAYMLKQEIDKAVLAYRKAVELDPKSAKFRGQLAVAERLKATADKLPAYRKGDYKPATTDERLALAQLCLGMKLHHTAAGLYAAAFEADPKAANDMRTQPRYNAACHAALAAAGQGSDSEKLDDAERTRLRKQALEWLRADLAAWRKLLDSGPPQARPAIGKTLSHWRQDPDLAAIRDASALGKLAEEERQAFAKLWSDVEVERNRAERAKLPPAPEMK